MPEKTIFRCKHCSATTPRWLGKCPECGTWDSLEETPLLKSAGNHASLSSNPSIHVVSMADIKAQDIQRIDSACPELNRVLGGGIVPGSVILLGGDPGIGKSTILLQTLATLAKQHRVLYISAEESLPQLGLKAKQLGIGTSPLACLSMTACEAIIDAAMAYRPTVMVVDSIQTVASQASSSLAGSVTQVRQCAGMLVEYAKNQGVCTWMVGHVTKEGTLAGPRVLEHLVDTVLTFEGSQDSRRRMIRAIKNRFGAVNELAVYAMTHRGLQAISNPSSIFLSQRHQQAGSIVTAVWEGSRPLLLECQALVDVPGPSPGRRVSVGIDHNRLALIIAIIQKHCRIKLMQRDIFINVVGGIKIDETACDLAIALALISSAMEWQIDLRAIAFGECGLSGEVRPIQRGIERLNEASKHGFTLAFIPKANQPRKTIAGIVRAFGCR